MLSSVASKFARVGWGGSDMYSRASFSSTGKYLPTGIKLGKNLDLKVEDYMPVGPCH